MTKRSKSDEPEKSEAEEAAPVGEQVVMGNHPPMPEPEQAMTALQYARSLGRNARVAGFLSRVQNSEPKRRSREAWAQAMADHKSRPVR